MTAPLTREENRYLTVEEVAARFAVSVDSIYRWCRKGCFPSPIVFGLRSSRWSLMDLVDYEAQQAANYTTPPAVAE